MNDYHTESLAEKLNDYNIDGIICFDAERKIQVWNSTAETLYARPKTEVLGETIDSVIPGLEKDQDANDAIKMALNGYKSFLTSSNEFPYRKHVENHFIPVKEGSVVTGVLNIAHDVGHRIKAEEKLQDLNNTLAIQYSQLLKTSDELASFTMISSNNIKQPIRNIYSTVESLIHSEAGQLSNFGKASFRKIQSSLNRMDLLLDDMLSVTKIGVPETAKQSVDLKQCFSKILNRLGNKIEESDAKIFAKDLPIIQGHPEQVFELFYQLLDNSIKFNQSTTPYVSIYATRVFTGKEFPIPFVEKPFIRISVSDNGIGFVQTEKDRIFKMFEKLNNTEYKGSGIGLAIVEKILDIHGGFILTESTPGKGSSFHCFFPDELRE